MKKYLICLMTIIWMVLTCSAVSACAGEIQIFDEGSRLSEDAFSTAYDRLQEAADNTNMNVAVILGNEARSEITIESMTDSTYDQLYGNKTDGICLYIDLSGVAHPYDYISTSGMGQFYYTNSSDSDRIGQIHYAIDKYLYPVGREDVEGALLCFADQLENYYEIGIPNHYWVYDDVSHEYYHVEDGKIIPTATKPYVNTGNLIMGGIIGLIIGLTAAGITRGAVKAKYRFIYELSPTNYLNKKTVRYTEQSDRFIRERTTKTHVSQSSGSRSGGSHHSSGGHSHGGHGGGGHHR